MKYENICKAIMKRAEESNVDYREFIRIWIRLFELTEVEDWNRNDFLNCMVKVKNDNK